MPFVTILPNEKLCPQGAKIEVKTGEKLAQSLNKAGINLPPSQYEACFLSFAHSDADRVQTLDACRQVLKTL